RSGQGVAESRCDDTAARVAALHNAIQPHKAVGPLACEAALDEIRLRGTARRTIILRAELLLSHGTAPEIHVNATGNAVKVAHPGAQDLGDEVSFGLGDRVRVIQDGALIGWLEHEPFMVARQRKVVTFDGQAFLQVPVLLRDAQ
ncbi:MAG: hypothetical protein AAF281_03660, partial [Pseudomonadota bacterium]